MPKRLALPSRIIVRVKASAGAYHLLFWHSHLGGDDDEENYARVPRNGPYIDQTQDERNRYRLGTSVDANSPPFEISR